MREMRTTFDDTQLYLFTMIFKCYNQYWNDYFINNISFQWQNIHFQILSYLPNAQTPECPNLVLSHVPSANFCSIINIPEKFSVAPMN